MIDCQNFEPLLSLFSNNELNVEQQEAVAVHLANCVTCQLKVDGYKQITTQLSGLKTPVLSERLFTDFQQGVLEKIAHSSRPPVQAFGFIATIYAFYRRQRLVVAMAALIMIIALPRLLTRYFHSALPESTTLTQLLEKRDWVSLYYTMLNSDLRAKLLNEPVPVNLLHAALKELASIQRGNPKLRAGLQQVLMRIKTREGNSFRLSRSIQILGKINATGFEPAKPPTGIVWNLDNILLILAQTEGNTTVTLGRLFHLKTFTENKR